MTKQQELREQYCRQNGITLDDLYLMLGMFQRKKRVKREACKRRSEYPSKHEQGYYTVIEARNVLDLPASTFDGLVRKGIIPKVRRGIYSKEAIDALAQARRLQQIERPAHLPIPEKTPINDALTMLQWKAIKEQYGYACLRCKRKEPDIELVADHVLPKVLGGLTIASNTQPLCRSCNAKKHSTYIDYR